MVLALSAGAAAITLISVEDEVAIGREAQAQVREQVPPVRDEVVGDYVGAIGRALAARAPGPRYPYSFSVANYREINAFALPGGPVWVHRGVLKAARNEAQVAGVLAHEIAHIAERHAAEKVTKVVIAEGLLTFLGAVLGNDGSARAARIAASLVTGSVFLKFNRDDEREADRVGAEIMSSAGWDPRGMIEFLQIMRQQQGRDPGSVEVFFSTHPAPEGRIALLEREVARLHSGRRDSARFAEVQRRLDRLPPAPPMRR